MTISRLVPAAIILVASFSVYLPGVNGNFMFDDYHNIVANTALHVNSLGLEELGTAAVSGAAGPLKRPIPMLSFALNYYIGQLHPLGYKLTNLTIHALNGLFVYWILLLVLCRIVTDTEQMRHRAAQAALISALAWVVHPINLSSVLYVVQRMTSLAALFMFAGVYLYLYGRVRVDRGDRGLGLIWGGSLVCGVLAAFSKENGVLLFPLLLVCEVLLFRFRTPTPGPRTSLLIFFSLTVFLPTAGLVAFLLSQPEWLGELYAAQDYTMMERLLTQGRVLWFYFSMLLMPNATSLGIFHDSLVLSTSVLVPVTTLPSVVGIGALFAAAVGLHKRAPVVSFGIMWFFVAHAVESTILPLEMAHEHRNYIPGVGVILVVVYYLMVPNYSDVIQKAARVGVLALVVVLGFSTALRADQWRNPVELAMVEAQHHPLSHRARYEFGRALAILYRADGDPAHLQAAREELAAAIPLSEIHQLPLFSLLQIDLMEGVEPASKTRALLNARLQSSRFNPTVSAGFYRLIQCGVDRLCEVPPDLMLELFGNALQNPGYPASAQRELLSLLAVYYVDVAGDLDAGRRVFVDVVEGAPDNLWYRLALARLLILMQRVAEAKTQLHEVEVRMTPRKRLFGFSELSREFVEVQRIAGAP